MGRFLSKSPSAALVAELDAAQQALQEGPRMQAAVAESVIRCVDLREEARWPRFAAAAIERGVHSMLSFQLYTRRGGAGALNLLGLAPRAFPIAAEAFGAVLATHAALALAAVNRQHQFESALASRDVIGQAKGIIMERFKIGSVRAFELLTKLSQDTNTPLRDVADRLVTSLTR